jgi:hypothetical protein
MTIEKIKDRLALEIEQMPLLTSCLPYKFVGCSIDHVTIDHINVTCGSCGTELAPDTIRGEITTVAGGRAASMISYGICFSCKTITPVTCKFHDDGTVLYKVGQGWVKDKWAIRKRGTFEDVDKFIRQRWQQVFPPLIAVALVMCWILGRR